MLIRLRQLKRLFLKRPLCFSHLPESIATLLRFSARKNENFRDSYTSLLTAVIGAVRRQGIG